MLKSVDRNFLELMKQGWIAGYPPWFHKFWTKHAKCKTEAENTHLLEFLRAIEDGKSAEVKCLLPGIDPNLRLAVEGTETESLLEWAIDKARDAGSITLLVKAGASVKAPWLIYKAVIRRDNKLLRDLLDAGADPNSGSAEENALCAACWDNAEAVRLLLDADARIDSTITVHITNNKSVKKVTPLMAAAYAGQPQIVKLLLEAGANPNAKDAKGNTALAWAKLSRAKKKAEKVITLLEDAGVTPASPSALPEQVDFSVRAKSQEFQTALQLAGKLTKSFGQSVDLENGILEGVRAFRVANDDEALDILQEIRSKTAALNTFTFLSEGLFEMDATHLVLVPDSDYRKAIIAFETPVGQSIDCYDLSKWLDNLQQKEPFVITHIAPDLVRARFTSKLKNSKWIAKQIHNICSDAMDSPVPALAKHLEQSRELFLWWD